VKIVLNQEPKDEFFVVMSDGDFLVRLEDIKSIGIAEPEGRIIEISGEEYISLESMKDVTFFFDEKNLSLQIALPPGLLPKKAIDLLPERRSKVYYPSDDSAFLNYRLNYYSVGDYNQYDLTNQVGVRFKKYYLFLSDSSYTMTDTEDRFTRLMTNITYDDRKVLKRTVYGDFLASSGELGSSVNMGGFSYSKAYQLDPYYVKYPMMNISGLVPLPSEIEIYIDGMLARKEKLSPGQFELNNIYSYRGAGAATIVIKDAFGRTETISYPFYFTDILLKKGLHEYSYNIGLLREDFGVESNAYGDFAFSAFHRHGFTDSLTLGVRSEATNGLYNLGPEGSYRIRNAGTISMSLAGSAGEKTGIAGSLSYIYQEKRLNAGMFTKWYSEEYANIGTLSLTERVRSEVGAVVGYGRKDFGSASLEYATTKKYDGLDRKVITATYSKSLSNKLTVFMNLRNIREEKDVNEVFVGLNYYIWDNASLSASHRSTESEDIDMLQMQKNTPLGEGIGYLVSAERSDSDSGSDTSLQAAMQYNTRNAVYEGEFRSGDGEEGSYRLSASGALVYLNNVFGIIRPINDSFGLVQTGSLEGVRVYQNNQEIGSTDSAGKIFIPNLGSYYENQVSISDKDIPMDYTMPEVIKYVSPPLRSGSYINFDVTRYQAVTGRILLKTDEKIKPVEFYEVRMVVGDKEVAFPTGKEGEFYLENLKPGEYGAAFDYADKTCSIVIKVPMSDETIIDIGGIVCEIIR